MDLAKDTSYIELTGMGKVLKRRSESGCLQVQEPLSDCQDGGDTWIVDEKKSGLVCLRCFS